MNKKRIGTVKQCLEAYPAFTNGGLRGWIFYNTDDFRTRCVIKVGSKLLIDYDEVDQWLKDHKEAA